MTLRQFLDDPVKTKAPVKTGTKRMNQLNEGARENLKPPPKPMHRPSGTSMHPTNDPAWEKNKMDRELRYYGVQVSMGATVRISMHNLKIRVEAA